MDGMCARQAFRSGSYALNRMERGQHLRPSRAGGPVAVCGMVAEAHQGNLNGGCMAVLFDQC